MEENSVVFDRYYDRFVHRWERVNPAPSRPVADVALIVLVGLVIVGAVVLSGTRTGAVVAETGGLSRFAEYIGLSSPVFAGIDAVLAFLAFDAALLLAGYLRRDQKLDARLYWVLLVAAAVPVFAANLLPATRHFTPAFHDGARVVVDVIIGIATPLMAFVAGKVVRIVRENRSKEYQDASTQWSERKGRSWQASGEYKAYRREVGHSSSKTEKPAKVTGQFPSAAGLPTLAEFVEAKAGGMLISELARGLGVSRAEIVAEAVKDDNLVLDGSKIKSVDF